MSGKKVRPGLHRRRSSLPNLKIMPLTMAQRRLLARKKRQQEQEAVKLAAQQAAEEKRQRAKKLRKATKAKDSDLRRRMTILGSFAHCRYCDAMVDQMEFDEHKVSHPSHIRQRIWLGNGENSRDINVMRTCGITHILNCTKEIELTKQISKKIKSFKRISIQDKNHETILDYINESSSFIEKALGESKFNVVFVHCREGRSRSVSFLSAYLMWKERQSFHAILSDITSKRWIVLPNNKFYTELEKLDKQLRLDRKNNSKKFGKPDDSFALGKVVGNMYYADKDNGETEKETSLEFNFPNSNSNSNQFTDEIKYDGDYQVTSPPSNKRHERRRSSLSDIDLSSPTQSPFNRNSVKLAIGHGYSMYSNKPLTPVVGSPVTKKKRAAAEKDKNSDPWAGVVYDQKKKKKKSNKSNKNNGSKKKSKNSKKKSKKKDLNVEMAMDVSDIFPTENGSNDSKTKKKKISKKDKKKKGSKKKKKKKNDE